MLIKWLREPLLHFLLIGGLLFLLYGLRNEAVVSDNNQIVITDTEVDRLILLWEKKRQRLPTQLELEGMIEQQVREEILYREALAMGLDRNDSIVRRRLAQKVEFIFADLAVQNEPTEAELENYLTEHAEKFEQPARISFVQIYLNIDKRGQQAEKDALRLLEQLKEQNSSVDIKLAGDPFMLSLQYEQLTKDDVSRLFGNDFTRQLFVLSDEDWHGPIQSGYGLHLIRIDQKTPAKQAELETVHDQVKNEWLAQQQRNMNKAFYQSLRQRYDVVIEDNTAAAVALSPE